MKKIISILFIVILVFVSVGCNVKDNYAKTDEVKDDAVDIQPSETTSKPDNAPPIIDKTDSPSKGEPSLVEYMFSSIKDMDTYITTGSTDPDDYDGETDPSLDEMLPAQMIRKCGYHSIYEYFDFDESIFDNVTASFQFDDEGWIMYNYLLDDTLVVIQSVKALDSSSTSEHFIKVQNVNSIQQPIVEKDLFSYSSDLKKIDNGYVLRKCGETEIVYKFNNGLKTVANILTDKAYISVCPISGVLDPEKKAEAYDRFATEKKYASFAALFADNEVTFSSAVTEIKTASKVKI